MVANLHRSSGLSKSHSLLSDKCNKDTLPEPSLCMGINLEHPHHVLDQRSVKFSILDNLALAEPLCSNNALEGLFDGFQDLQQLEILVRNAVTNH